MSFVTNLLGGKEPASPGVPPASYQRPVVLVSDDDPLVGSLMKATLGTLYEVVVVGDGRQALDLARRLHPAVVILDYMIPGVNGIDACRSLKEDPEMATSAVVLSTGFRAILDTPAARVAGADAFLRKPFGPSDLMRLVQHFAPA